LEVFQTAVLLYKKSSKTPYLQAFSSFQLFSFELIRARIKCE